MWKGIHILLPNKPRQQMPVCNSFIQGLIPAGNISAAVVVQQFNRNTRQTSDSTGLEEAQSKDRKIDFCT